MMTKRATRLLPGTAKFIDPGEWNFYQLCPTDELEECLVYECARRSSLWPFALETLARLDSYSQFCPDYSAWNRIYEFLIAFSEFPERPWLSIPSEKRSTFLAKLLIRARQWAPVESAKEEDFGIYYGREPDLDPNEAEGPSWPQGVEILSRYRIASRVRGGQLHVIRVDWHRDNEDLVRSFADWVKRERNADYGRYNRKGRTSLRPDVLRAALRNLGAWSLSQRAGITKAQSLRETVHKNEYGADEKLFPSSSELTRAAKNAATRIETLSPWHFAFEWRKAEAESAVKSTFPESLTRDGYTVRIGDGMVVFERPYETATKHAGRNRARH